MEGRASSKNAKNERRLNPLSLNTPSPCSTSTPARLVALAAFCWLGCFAAVQTAAGQASAGETPVPAALSPAPATGAAEENDAPLIELDGSISISPDGSELSYRWEQLSGPRVTLSNPAAANPQFRTSAPGIYEFQLIVSANGLDSEPHVVRLEIERENLPPVAKVAAEAWGQVGRVLEVDGAASFDPEGEELTYQWRAVTPGLSIPPDALRKPVLVVEPDAEGVFEIELIVSDGEKTSAPVRCMLGVRPRPRLPVAQARIVALDSPPGGGSAPAADIAAMAPPKREEPNALAPLPRFARIPPAALPPVDDLVAVSDPVPLPPPSQPMPRLSAPPPAIQPPPALLSIPPIPATQAMTALTESPVQQIAPLPKASDPPVAIVVAPTRALTGSLVAMDATQSRDPLGKPLTYRWRQTGGPRVTKYSIDERLGDAAPAFTPEEPGLYSFSMSVFNGTIGSEPIDIDIDVAAAPPAAQQQPVSDQPENGLRRVPELLLLPGAAPPPASFPTPRIENMKDRPAARVLNGARKQ